jgi:preprotein translocase subunit Sec63
VILHWSITKLISLNSFLEQSSKSILIWNLYCLCQILFLCYFVTKQDTGIVAQNENPSIWHYSDHLKNVQ